jgi:mono/diheme cytochrome c family protein
MRGGPRGVRDTLERGRRRPLHAGEFALAGAIALFGLIVPAIVLSSDQASAGPGGTKLSADMQSGRELFNDRCATCHTLSDAGAVGRVGPDLDVLAPTAGLTVNAIKEGRARGQGQMPAQLLEGEDAKHVAEYVEEVAGR